jgi:cytidyltransferase-like protein
MTSLEELIIEAIRSSIRESPAKADKKKEDLGFGFNEEGYPLQDRYEFQGFDIAVENKKGSTRRWYDKDGKEKGSTKMRSDYGYIEGALGADQEAMDVYVGPDEKAEFVYVVHQNKAPDFEEYDEDKVMLGFSSEDDAKEAYLKQYNDPRFYGGMSSMPLDKFKEKIKTSQGVKITNEAKLFEIAPKDLPKSIAHLEDLKPGQFLEFLRKYRDLPIKGGLEISEKVDGSARISFGIKDKKIWTQSKHGTPKTSAEQYGDNPMYVALRAAHTALASKESEIAKAWPRGVAFFVAEVLYTRIPNSIEYGPNAIVVHGVHLDSNKVLDDVYSERMVKRVTERVGELSDGKEKWIFEYKRNIDPKDFQVDIHAEYDSIQQIYNELKKLEPGKSTVVGKDQYRAVLDQFKAVQLALKKKLLSQMKGQKSGYGPEGGDIEGLVFRDLESGEMVKLVDRDYFTKINKFLWFYREMLDRGVKIGDEWKFGLMQQLRNAMADEVLGHSLAKTPNFINRLKEFGRGFELPEELETPEERVDFILALYVEDNKLMSGDYLGKAQSILKKIEKNFKAILSDWTKHRDDKLDVKNDQGDTVKSVKMDELNAKRTDEAFARMATTLKEFEDGLKKLGGIENELTRKTILLKMIIGRERLEKLAGESAQVQEQKLSEEVTQTDVQNFKKIIDANKEALARHDVHVGRQLGSGAKGMAFSAGSGKALKITKDADEARASNLLKKKSLKYVAKIFDVFRFKEIPDSSDTYYGIVLEELKPISAEDEQEFNEAIMTFDETLGPDWFTKNKKELLSWAEMIAQNNPHKKEEIQKAFRSLEKFNYFKIIEELASHNVDFADLHPGNLLKRGDEYVAIDLGVSSSPGKEPDVLEVRQISEDDKDEKEATSIDVQLGKKYLKMFKDRLEKRGIKIPDNPPVLGTGTRGTAFDLGNKVLKLTGDESEAIAANKIKDLHLKHVVKIFDVFKMGKGEYAGLLPVYGVYQEKLVPIPGSDPDFDKCTGEALALNEAIDGTFMFNAILTVGDAKKGYTWEQLYKKMYSMLKERMAESGLEEAQEAQKIFAESMPILLKFQIPKMVDELGRSGIDFGDYHAGNIMKRGGDYVLIDVGHSRVDGGKEPEMIERVVESVVSSIREAPRSASKPAAMVTGDSKIEKALEVNREALERKQIQIHLEKFLGKGTYGSAFEATYKGKKCVAKLTEDTTEAVASNHIKGKLTKKIVRIFDVFKLRDCDLYLILQEKLNRLSSEETQDFNTLVNILSAAKAGEGMIKGNMELVRHEVLKKFSSRHDLLTAFDYLVDEFGFGAMLKELHSLGIEFLDFHGENLMKRGSEYVIIDLGMSRSPGSEPPMIESIIKEIILEAKADTVGVTIGRFQPFHKGHAKMIRDLAQKFTKVLVLIAGNKIDKRNPFSYDLRLDLMKKSLPEILNKIEFHKAEIEGKGSGFVPGILSDIAINKKSSLNADTAFHILVGPDRVQEMKKQFESAKKYKEEGNELFFDPNLAVVTEIPGVKEDGDTDRISATQVREALLKDDKETVKKLMDAHLVSNPADFEDLYVRMRKELGAEPVQKESRELQEDLKGAGGKQALKKALDANKDSLAARKPFAVNVDSLHELGNGMDGVAYDMGQNKVFKVTSDKGEAFSSMQVFTKNKNLQHVVKIFDVFHFKNTGGASGDLYGIVLEKLTPLTDKEKLEYERITDWVVGGEAGSLVQTKVKPFVKRWDWSGLVKELENVIRNDIYKSFGLQPPVSEGPEEQPDVTANDRTGAARPSALKTKADGASSPDQKKGKAEEMSKQTYEKVVTALKKYQFPEMLADLKTVGVQFTDFHSGNLMKRGGQYVITDLGRSVTGGGSQPPPMLDHAVREIIEQVMFEAGAATAGALYGTPGSTQSGVRAGSSPWSSAMDRVTDDPEEKVEWQNQLKNLQPHVAHDTGEEP